MRYRLAGAVLAAACAFAAWYFRSGNETAAAAGPVEEVQALEAGGELRAAAVGHEYREDDLPAIAAAPDGSVWIAWLSFSGERDDIALRRRVNGKWGNIHWVPATSGDGWLPQVAVDRSNRPWVVWSQQVNGNWDLYGRRFDPARQEWGPLERFTSDPLPDINPRLWSDGTGRAAVVWQGFRNGNSNIFLQTFDGESWSPEVRVTNRPVNDWEPAVALDGQNTAWVAYDNYASGSYDVYLSRVRQGDVQGPEVPVTSSPRFEAKATVAADTAGRVWVAWEAGLPNWGKDNGAVIRHRAPGVRLGLDREPRIRCFENGQWRDPKVPLASMFQEHTYQPHVFSDGQGSVWVAAQVRRIEGDRIHNNVPNSWEYWVTHYDGAGWSKPVPLPHSRGRSSTRINAVLGAGKELWLAWPTDNRSPRFYHRPLRQQVWAGMLPPARPAAPPEWGMPAPDNVEVKPGGHPDEAGDVRAARAYTTTIGGRRVRLLRGDFHRHTELSWDSGGNFDAGLQDMYRYMLDVAALDFGASTDHQGGGWPYWWWYSQKMTDMYHAPGAYVAIFGYERSAGWPHSHRNMFFARRSESRITPFFLRDGTRAYALGASPEGDEPEIATGALVENDTRLLYEELRGRGAIAIAHTTGTNGGTDWRDNDPELEPVVEIYQGARTSYEAPGAPYVMTEQEFIEFSKRRAGAAPSSEQVRENMARMTSGLVSNAWAKGYRLGVISSSDHYSTHISYAMVYTADPTRQGILDAIRRRHTYGAMDNIILEVRMGEHFMGDAFRLARPEPVTVIARGTRPVAKVEVIRDNRVAYTAEPKSRDVRFQYTDRDPAAGRHFYYVRLTQEDGMLAWSSPLFVEYR